MDIADIISRLRIVEEDLENVMKRVSSLEISIVREMKSLKEKIDEIREKINNLEDRIENLEFEISLIKDRMKDFAKKEDIRVLEKYIDFLNPSKYVTVEEMRRILKEILGEK